MRTFERVKSVAIGVLSVIVGILLQVTNNETNKAFTLLVAAVLCLSLIAMGIRYMAFYFQMSHNMIGGLNHLMMGLVLLDAGLLLSTLDISENTFVALYLVGISLFSGGIALFQALEQKRLGAQHWKLKFYRGLIQVVMGIGCLFFMGNVDYLMMIFGFSLIISGIIRTIEAFRPTDIVYIQ